MPNIENGADIPYYYDFESGNNSFIQTHVETVFRQAEDIINKQSLYQQLRKGPLETYNMSIVPHNEICQGDRITTIKCGAEVILRLFKEIPNGVFKLERAIVEDWLNGCKNCINGYTTWCQSTTTCDVQIHESVSKFGQVHPNVAQRCFETRILQYTMAIVANRYFPKTQKPPIKPDDLDIDAIIEEFKSKQVEVSTTLQPSPQARNILMQGLRQQILKYIKDFHSRLSSMERAYFYKNLQQVPNVNLFDLLGCCGFDCLLNENLENYPKSFEEEKLRDNLAMEFVSSVDFANEVIDSCMSYAKRGSRGRMNYTKNFKI